MIDVQRAILKTLEYADIFSYPLYSRQIYKYLVNQRRVSKKNIERELKRLVKQKFVIKDFQSNLYALSNRVGIFSIRKSRERTSRKKLFFAKHICAYLRLIPTIQLIGISGGLALNNAKRGDDIDLFIVASDRTLWMTRLFCIVILELLGVRRRPNMDRVNNLICLNMLVDIRHLMLPLYDRNLYTAHEVIQLRPIFSRGETYKHFLRKNLWVREFLANSIGRIKNKESGIKKEQSSFRLFLTYIFSSIFLFLPETAAKTIQLWYMRKRRTNEIIHDGYMRFHPYDTCQKVLSKYQWRVVVMKNRLARRNAISSPLPFPAFP